MHSMKKRNVVIAFISIIGYSCFIYAQKTILEFKLHVAEARISILTDQVADFSARGTYDEGLTDGLLRANSGTYSDGYKDGYHYATK